MWNGLGLRLLSSFAFKYLFSLKKKNNLNINSKRWHSCIGIRYITRWSDVGLKLNRTSVKCEAWSKTFCSKQFSIYDLGRHFSLFLIFWHIIILYFNFFVYFCLFFIYFVLDSAHFAHISLIFKHHPDSQTSYDRYRSFFYIFVRGGGWMLILNENNMEIDIAARFCAIIEDEWS